MTNILVLPSTGVGIARPKWKKFADPFVLIACLAFIICGPAKVTASSDFDQGMVSWDRLVFRAAGYPNQLRVEVALREVPSGAIGEILGFEPGKEPNATAAFNILQMSSTIEVFLTGRTYRTDVWFSPTGLSPIQRQRDKIGSDPSRKTFRYLPEGVRRLRLQPNGGDEAAKGVEHWTKIKEDYFPYGPGRTACSVLSDPSLLLLAAATAAVSQESESRTLCVFNKRTIHSVQLVTAEGETIEANYTEFEGANRENLRREVKARNIRITTLASQSEGPESEPFEFFEMEGEIEIDFDRDSGLPLRILSEIRGLGRVEFLLSEVTWRL